MQNGAPSDCQLSSDARREKRRWKLTVANACHVLVGEDSVFVEVCQASRLLDEGGRETMSVSLVVSELRVDKIIDLL